MTFILNIFLSLSLLCFASESLRPVNFNHLTCFFCQKQENEDNLSLKLKAAKFQKKQNLKILSGHCHGISLFVIEELMKLKNLDQLQDVNIRLISNLIHSNESFAKKAHIYSVNQPSEYEFSSDYETRKEEILSFYEIILEKRPTDFIFFKKKPFRSNSELFSFLDYIVNRFQNSLILLTYKKEPHSAHAVVISTLFEKVFYFDSNITGFDLDLNRPGKRFVPDAQLITPLSALVYQLDNQ